jgi:homospermidine synthase
MKLRYGSLEGPENGVYVRGELNGSNIIEVPDHWIGLVHEDSYTVHLTPIERYSQLYVEKIENYNVYIADNFMNPIHCYYSVWAERKDIPKLVTEY